MSEPVMLERLLGLPLRSRRDALACALAVFALLALTMPHAIGLFDEGELAVAAYELGLGHAPGQPLHAMLGFVFSHLPGLAPATGLVLLSALATALAVLPTLALVQAATARDAARWIAPFAVLVVSLHGIVWEAATRIEVYPLAATAGLFALAFAATSETHGGRIGVLLGLSASANPAIAAVCGAACLPLLMRFDRPAALRLARVFGGGLLGLLPYAYLALVAQRTDAFVWGGLADRAELVHYLSGADYAGNLAAPLDVRLEQAATFVDHLARERAFAGVLCAAAIGWVLLARSKGRLASALALLVALPVALVASNAVFRVEIPDYLGYFTIGALACAPLTALALDLAHRRSRLALLFAAVIALGTIFGSPAAWTRSRAQDDIAQRIALAILDAAPHDAFLVVESDHLVAPALYAQRVLQHRTDVVVVARGLMSSSWYLRLLDRQHPSLHTYAIAGPGARDGRIARMLMANPERAIRVEHLGIAERLGGPACPSGILWAFGPECTTPAAPELGPLLELAARAHALPDGALDGHAIVGAITYRLGLDLQRAGRARDAYTVLVAGLPDSYRGPALPEPSAIPERIAFDGPDPTFSRTPALADPARNALVTAYLLARANQIDAAIELTERAAMDGLPEAEALLRGEPR